MNWNNWVRQVHRWLSIAFTLAVIANFTASALRKETYWIGLLALLPLGILLLSGLHLFMAPYLSRRGRRGARADAQACATAWPRRWWAPVGGRR